MVAAQKIALKLAEEFASRRFAGEEFPLLTEWGVRDESILIHSLGCNYLAALGRHFGFRAINEFPVRASGGRMIRPDAVWWDRKDNHITFLAEFERFRAGQESKLVDKAKNLVEAYHSVEPRPPVVLLMAWAHSGTDLTKARAAAAVARDGFRTQGGNFVSGVDAEDRFLFYFAVFGRSGENLKLINIQP